MFLAAHSVVIQSLAMYKLKISDGVATEKLLWVLLELHPPS
jgi:hypothetical protein